MKSLNLNILDQTLIKTYIFHLQEFQCTKVTRLCNSPILLTLEMRVMVKTAEQFSAKF